MNGKRNSLNQFVMLDGYAEALRNVPDEVAGAYIKAVIGFFMYDEELTSTNPLAKALLSATRHSLKKSKMRALVGQKGGSKGRTNAEKTCNIETLPKQTPSKGEANCKHSKKGKLKSPKNGANFKERDYDYKELEQRFAKN